MLDLLNMYFDSFMTIIYSIYNKLTKACYALIYYTVHTDSAVRSLVTKIIP